MSAITNNSSLTNEQLNLVLTGELNPSQDAIVSGKQRVLGELREHIRGLDVSELGPFKTKVEHINRSIKENHWEQVGKDGLDIKIAALARKRGPLGGNTDSIKKLLNQFECLRADQVDTCRHDQIDKELLLQEVLDEIPHLSAHDADIVERDLQRIQYTVNGKGFKTYLEFADKCQLEESDKVKNLMTKIAFLAKHSSPQRTRDSYMCTDHIEKLKEAFTNYSYIKVNPKTKTKTNSCFQYEGRPHGKAIITKADGTVTQCRYHRGKLMGKSITTTPEKFIIEANCTREGTSNDMRDSGTCSYRGALMYTYEGTWGADNTFRGTYTKDGTTWTVEARENKENKVTCTHINGRKLERPITATLGELFEKTDLPIQVLGTYHNAERTENDEL